MMLFDPEKRAKISLISICFLVLLVFPILHLNLGLPTDGNTKSKETTERRAYDLLTEGYGEGIILLSVQFSSFYWNKS
jgi:hypothetical protein